MATIPLTITIRDYRYSANITVPSEVPSQPPPVIKPPYTPPPPPSAETRIVRILPEGEKRLPDANSGETVKITATVICRTADIISKPRDTAYLIVDGAIADRKTIENGIVTFDWEATAVPINIHNICVKVDPSATCKSPGQDCKRITVSPSTLGIAEQLAKERASTSEQRRLLEEARSALRGEIIGAELQIPGATITPLPTYTPPVYEPPITTTPPTLVPPPTATQPDYGNISIVGLPAILLPIKAELPIYVYIDDKNIGRLYELPKTVTDVSVGTHSVYVRAGDITTPTKTASVIKGETTTVTI